MKEAVERQRKSLKKRQSGKLLFLQMFNLEFIYWLLGLFDCLRQVGFSIILWPLSSWSISDSRIQRRWILSLDLWCGTLCVCVWVLGRGWTCLHVCPYLNRHFRTIISIFHVMLFECSFQVLRLWSSNS